jgi:hypothetical protein
MGPEENAATATVLSEKLPSHSIEEHCMSAIVGLYTFNQQPVMTADLVRMGDRLTAYGPDRAGSWQQGEVGLAQRQMIITPEDLVTRQFQRK